MRIQTIEIIDYKAFLGTHKINVGGKNLFICGENGSHYNTERHEIKTELASAIQAVKNLKVELGKL
jgi:hypothetical protein